MIVNSARGRQKDRNMRRNAKVAMSIQDPDNPYHYVLVRVTYKIEPEHVTGSGR